MNNFSNKLSTFAVTLIMGAIILAFVLTGFEGFNSTVGKVATVGDEVISSSEFNRQLQFNIDQYTRMLQGKSLTSKQIKDFRLKEMALQTLISQKHMLNFAKGLEFGAGKLYIKDEIKEYKMFQSGGKFDVSKYKQLLRVNNLSPSMFEKQISDQVKSKQLGLLISSVQDSVKSVSKFNKLQNLKMDAMVVSFDKEAMTKNIKIDSTKVTEFIKDEKNKGTLEGLYQTYISELKAKNPKAKEKTLKSMKKELATKHLQKTSRKELTEFNQNLAKEVTTLLKENKSSKLQKLAKKYGFKFKKSEEISVLNPKYEGNEFKVDEFYAHFKSKNTADVLTANGPVVSAFIKAKGYKTKAKEQTELKQQLSFSAQRNTRNVQMQVLRHQEENTKVTTNSNL